MKHSNCPHKGPPGASADENGGNDCWAGNVATASLTIMTPQKQLNSYFFAASCDLTALTIRSIEDLSSLFRARHSVNLSPLQRGKTSLETSNKSQFVVWAQFIFAGSNTVF